MEHTSGNSDTAKKLRKRANLKPFAKGFDPRRNLNGRPRNFDEVRALAQQLAHKKEANGLEAITNVLAEWRESPEPSLQRAFVEYAFGKVPDKIEATGLENKTVLALHFDHERGVTRE